MSCPSGLKRSFLIRGRWEQRVREGNVRTEGVSDRMRWLWRWRQGPQCKEWGGSLEAGSGKETDSLVEPPEGASSVDTLTSVQ